MTIKKLFLFFLIGALVSNFAHAADKPKLTLDEFFDWVEVTSVQISPDGRSVVMVADRADWDLNIFRDDLWLYRDDGGGSLMQLTQSGHDTHPRWSPDGKWIAFVSDHKRPKAGDHGSSQASSDSETAQLYLISPQGGEAFAVTTGTDDVHAFAWSADSRVLFYATRTPWSTTQEEAYKKEWKDVIQYRAAERGDEIFAVNIAGATSRDTSQASKPDDSESVSGATPSSRSIASTPFRVHQMTPSPDGRRLAFSTTSISGREEKVDQFEIYAVDLTNASTNQVPRRITHNEAEEEELQWSRDNRHVFFKVEYGSVEGKYHDTQQRLYWVDTETGQTERWASDFAGAIIEYSVSPDGGVLACGRVGTEVQVFSARGASKPFSKLTGRMGTYEYLSAAAHSPRVAFVYSSLDSPNEVFLADDAGKLGEARQITSFNILFTERDLPQGKPYRWTADDGSPVEGMLMYPPGKFEAKNLPMFALIHGGPNDADGNHFEADWYVWDRMAATQGWLVFEPNYRGSNGYGDKFLMETVPQMVSRPGKDILEGVDALVKDGIADPDHLAVGGYSSGGYMANWLITQSTRWKAAVTGGGAVESVADWGNDDTTYDDAYFLGGEPWKAPQRYHDEAAIYQIDKVRTPTHIVSGADDTRVAVAEAYLLDHALYNLDVPSTLLIFPGEGHELDKNPWHGKIKVREELKWLQKYGGIPAVASGVN